MALSMGRTICFSDASNVRQLASAYRHHYIVGPWGEIMTAARAQAAAFIPMASVKGLLVEIEQPPSAEEIALVGRFCPGGRIAWTAPGIGIVGIAEIPDVLAGRIGAHGPWVEIRLAGDTLDARLKVDPDRRAKWVKTTLPARLAS
jgi:hypothetical protein